MVGKIVLTDENEVTQQKMIKRTIQNRQVICEGGDGSAISESELDVVAVQIQSFIKAVLQSKILVVFA